VSAALGWFGGRFQWRCPGRAVPVDGGGSGTVFSSGSTPRRGHSAFGSYARSVEGRNSCWIEGDFPTSHSHRLGGGYSRSPEVLKKVGAGNTLIGTSGPTRDLRRQAEDTVDELILDPHITCVSSKTSR
jgi:hypothetical protein